MAEEWFELLWSVERAIERYTWLCLCEVQCWLSCMIARSFLYNSVVIYLSSFLFSPTIALRAFFLHLSTATCNGV
jgi:hypothetical protein